MNWVARFWFPEREGEKNPVKKELAEVATEDCDRLLGYADRQGIDPAEAQNLVEILVEDLAARQQRVPASKKIRNLRPYLFTSFARAVNALRAKDKRFERAESAKLERLAAGNDWAEEQDRKILAREVIELMDAETRRTYWRLAELYSWKYIARQQGVSVNTAIKTYQRGLQRVIEKIETDRRKRKS